MSQEDFYFISVVQHIFVVIIPHRLVPPRPPRALSLPFVIGSDGRSDQYDVAGHGTRGISGMALFVLDHHIFAVVPPYGGGQQVSFFAFFSYFVFALFLFLLVLYIYIYPFCCCFLFSVLFFSGLCVLCVRH